MSSNRFSGAIAKILIICYNGGIMEFYILESVFKFNAFEIREQEMAAGNAALAE